MSANDFNFISEPRQGWCLVRPIPGGKCYDASYLTNPAEDFARALLSEPVAGTYNSFVIDSEGSTHEVAVGDKFIQVIDDAGDVVESAELSPIDKTIMLVGIAQDIAACPERWVFDWDLPCGQDELDDEEAELLRDTKRKFAQLKGI